MNKDRRGYAGVTATRRGASALSLLQTLVVNDANCATAVKGIVSGEDEGQLDDDNTNGIADPLYRRQTRSFSK